MCSVYCASPHIIHLDLIHLCIDIYVYIYILYICVCVHILSFLCHELLHICSSYDSSGFNRFHTFQVALSLPKKQLPSILQ